MVWGRKRGCVRQGPGEGRKVGYDRIQGKDECVCYLLPLLLVCKLFKLSALFFFCV